MASNAIPEPLDPLVALAEDAADGADGFGMSVGIKHNTAAAIRADLHALMGNHAVGLVGKQQAWLAAKSARAAASTAKSMADSNTKAFLAGAIGWLKNHLGTSWNAQWEAAGFNGGSIAVPESADGRFTALAVLRDYFTTHPAHELVSPVNEEGNPTGPHFTSADADAMHVAGSDMRAASAASNAAAGAAKAARDAAQAALRRRLSGLLAELRQLLADDDARWNAFGFSRPADPETPQVPDLVTLIAGAPGTVLADWDDSRRADRYKVYRQLPTDAAPVLAADNVMDTDAVLTGLPSGIAVLVTVVALNSAGPSLPSAPASITVP